MAKKGIIQLQDVTFVLVIILMFMVSYLFFHKSNPIVQPVSYSTKMDIDPPLSSNPVFFPPDNPQQNGHPIIKAIPINVETRKMNTTNTQLGFLRLEHEESNKTRNALILPLMGRRITTSNEKWYYYTMSNTGVINTPLPIWINGRKCTNERGSDILNCGDRVFVEGYDNAFIVSLYENERMTYIPYI
jgi:hypothetical protein